MLAQEGFQSPVRRLVAGAVAQVRLGQERVVDHDRAVPETPGVGIRHHSNPELPDSLDDPDIALRPTSELRQRVLMGWTAVRSLGLLDAVERDDDGPLLDPCLMDQCWQAPDKDAATASDDGRTAAPCVRREGIRLAPDLLFPRSRSLKISLHVPVGAEQWRRHWIDPDFSPPWRS